MKTVSELCKQIKGIYNVEGNVETPITGIAADSREIEPGNLFVCISAFTSTALPLPSRLWKKAPSPS